MEARKRHPGVKQQAERGAFWVLRLRHDILICVVCLAILKVRGIQEHVSQEEANNTQRVHEAIADSPEVLI